LENKETAPILVAACKELHRLARLEQGGSNDMVFDAKWENQYVVHTIVLSNNIRELHSSDENSMPPKVLKLLNVQKAITYL